MSQPTNYTPQFSSSHSEELVPRGDLSPHRPDELDELFEWLECDDFWWDEEDRHELY